MTLRRVVIGVLAALLLPAVVLTWARLLDPREGPWVRVVAFTPYAVPLYALAALVLGVAWWRAAGRRRTTARLLTLAVGLPLAVHLVWAAGPYVGPGTAPAERGSTFRVLTANLRLGRADPARVVRAAVEHRVDVLVLEEVTPTALAGMRAAGLGAAFGHRAGRPADGAAGTVVLSRRPIRHVRPLGTGLGGYRMEVRVPGGEVTLLAVHVRPPDAQARGWAADLSTVRGWAVGEDGPTVIAGDFNATPDHVAMRDLRGRGFDDAATQARSGWQPTWPSSGAESVLGVPLPPLLQVDHVLVNAALRATRTESISLPGTDHRALLAILTR